MRNFRTFANVPAGNDPAAADYIGATNINNFLGELEAAVTRSGQSITSDDGTDDNDKTQLAKSLFLHSVKAQQFQDNGSANTYQLTPISGSGGVLLPASYAQMDGARVWFVPAFSNTTNSTINIGQTTGTLIGAKKALNFDGSALASGVLKAGNGVAFIYSAAADSATGAWLMADNDALKANLTANTFTGTQTISGANALRGSYGGGGVTTNFASGDGALAANTTGSNNTASGVSALNANTTGFNNTAIGTGTLSANTTGGSNTASGVSALNANTTGFNNTASGVSALAANTTGSNNTASGTGTLSANTTGANNTAIGTNALGANTTGFSNTASGVSALNANTTGFNNTASGTNALNANTTGSNNTASGTGTLSANTTGSNNTASGWQALLNNTTGSGNTAINPKNSAGTYAPVFDPSVENNRLCMGSTGVTNAYVQVAWTVVSDARDKTDFAPVPHGLDFVSKLKTTAYRYKMNREDTEGHGPVRYGFKAQDVLALEGDTPVIVDAENLDKLRFNDQAMIAVLVNAMQELNAKHDALNAKFDALTLTHP